MACRGLSRAQVGLAHSVLVSAYHMLSPDEPCHDLGPDWLCPRDNKAHVRPLVIQLERLGHTVVLDPAA
jgi:transposase